MNTMHADVASKFDREVNLRFNNRELMVKGTVNGVSSCGVASSRKERERIYQVRLRRPLRGESQ